MASAHRSHAHPRRLRLHDDRQLLFIAEAASVRPPIVLRPGRRRPCQLRFDGEVLSSAANTTAYFRAGAGMKPGAPVDRNRAAVDQISPAAQAVLRELRRRGILPDGHAAPVQRLHMHRPERLDRLVALVLRQFEPAPLATSATLVMLGFGKDSGVLCTDPGHFRICDRTQPTCERRVRETVRPAVAALRQAAALPCLDVHSPP